MLLYWGFPGGSDGKESTCSAGDAGDMGSIPGLEYPLEEGRATYLHQYSCLENPVDRGVWQATVHGVARVRQELVIKLPPLPEDKRLMEAS